MVECEIIEYPSDSDWLKMRNDALVSQGKKSEKVPSRDLKVKYLVSKHTPIYTLQYTWQWTNLPYWISVQLSRSNIGIHHIVKSQRNDIQKEYDRKKAPQDSPVIHRCVANPVAIMNTSQKRLCYTASMETRKVWGLFLEKLNEVSPELAVLCVKPCVAMNGFCSEVFSNCKFNTSSAFIKELEVDEEKSNIKHP